jgi:hypothetical protein
MTKKRTRIARSAHSRLRLTTPWRCHLECGSYLLAGSEPFEDEQHRREVWEHNRAEMMSGGLVGGRIEPWCGRRPLGFWQYERQRPPEAVSESDAVYMLDDTSAEERGAIETAWLDWIRRQVEWRAVHGREITLQTVKFWDQPPAWFVDRHRPAIVAEIRAKYPSSRYL